MEIASKLKEASHLNAGFIELTTALGGTYYLSVKQGLPGAVSLPFTSYSKEIAGAGKLAAIFFVLLGIKDHQHQLDETNRKTCNPNNN